MTGHFTSQKMAVLAVLAARIPVAQEARARPPLLAATKLQPLERALAHLPDFGNVSAPKSSGTVCGVKYSRRTSSALTNRTSAAYFFSHCAHARTQRTGGGVGGGAGPGQGGGGGWWGRSARGSNTRASGSSRGKKRRDLFGGGGREGGGHQPEKAAGGGEGGGGKPPAAGGPAMQATAQAKRTEQSSRHVGCAALPAQHPPTSGAG